MSRPLAALLALCAALPALAADPAKPPSLPAATVTVANATLKDGAIQVTQFTAQQVQVPVTVNEKVGDKVVTVTKTVVETRMVPVIVAFSLKEVKATGTDGKAIPAADLEKKLKDGGPVVLTTFPIGDELRAVFKDGTVFIDQSGSPQPPK